MTRQQFRAETDTSVSGSGSEPRAADSEELELVPELPGHAEPPGSNPGPAGDQHSDAPRVQHPCQETLQRGDP